MNRALYPAVSVIALVVSNGVAQADPNDIRENDAIKIVFDKDIRSDVNEPGDHIVVRVEKDPTLPKDTTLEGYITRMHWATPYRAASVDMTFTTLRLPNGTRFHIDAVPTPLNDPHLTHGTDGRLISSYKPGAEGAYVLGGTVGGLILGGIGHRPILGGLIGGLVGAIAGSEDRRENANLVVRHGTQMAAIFRADVALTNGPNYRPSFNPPVPPPAGSRPFGSRYGAPLSGAPLSSAPGWRHQEGMPIHNPTPPPSSAPAPTPQPAQNLQIKVDGQVLTFDDAKPYTAGNVVMVPVQAVADQLNLATTVHDNGSVTIDGPTNSGEISDGQTSWHGANTSVPLPHKAETKNGVLYAPINVFSRIMESSVTVNGSTVSG